MLSREEKKEMLKDAKDGRRRKDFDAAKSAGQPARSFDVYIAFLDSAQNIFSPFKASRRPTLTKFNKL
jgi:hypothetical protein